MCAAVVIYLPAHIVDVSFVQKFEHKFVMNQREHPNKWTKCVHYDTQDKVCNRIHFIIDQLTTKFSFPVRDLRHFENFD